MSLDFLHLDGVGPRGTTYNSAPRRAAPTAFVSTTLEIASMTDRYPPQKLAANRAAKQEEYENSHKLSAQFRSLDPDVINFLDEVSVRRFEEEKKVREGDEAMLKGFRACVLFF
jgi:hypothetical protein